MTLVEFSAALSSTALSQLIQTTSWIIPSLQTVHYLSIAILFASALMIDLRILGAGIRTEALNSVVARFTRPIWICLLILLLTGALLIVAEPGRTITNQVFYLKMGLLAVAVLITLFLRFASTGERSSMTSRALAFLSIATWAAIIVAGRYIAYVSVL